MVLCLRIITFFDSLQKMLVKKIDGNYKENFYKVVPSDMNLDLRAAPILVVSSFSVREGIEIIREIVIKNRGCREIDSSTQGQM